MRSRERTRVRGREREREDEEERMMKVLSNILSIFINSFLINFDFKNIIKI